jgi:hypothetical protein
LRRANPLAKLAFLLAVGIALAAVSACGGAGTASFKKGGPPAPPACLQRYNKNSSALSLGKHAYSLSHGSRAARVFHGKPSAGLGKECVVVYADVESDREYGTLAQFSYGKQWLNLIEYPVQSERERLEIQRSGAESANVKLHKDGTITPF